MRILTTPAAVLSAYRLLICASTTAGAVRFAGRYTGASFLLDGHHDAGFPGETVFLNVTQSMQVIHDHTASHAPKLFAAEMQRQLAAHSLLTPLQSTVALTRCCAGCWLMISSSSP